MDFGDCGEQSLDDAGLASLQMGKGVHLPAADADGCLYVQGARRLGSLVITSPMDVHSRMGFWPESDAYAGLRDPGIISGQVRVGALGTFENGGLTVALSPLAATNPTRTVLSLGSQVSAWGSSPADTICLRPKVDFGTGLSDLASSSGQVCLNAITSDGLAISPALAADTAPIRTSLCLGAQVTSSGWRRDDAHCLRAGGSFQGESFLLSGEVRLSEYSAIRKDGITVGSSPASSICFRPNIDLQTRHWEPGSSPDRTQYDGYGAIRGDGITISSSLFVDTPRSPNGFRLEPKGLAWGSSPAWSIRPEIDLQTRRWDPGILSGEVRLGDCGAIRGGNISVSSSLFANATRSSTGFLLEPEEMAWSISPAKPICFRPEVELSTRHWNPGITSDQVRLGYGWLANQDLLHPPVLTSFPILPPAGRRTEALLREAATEPDCAACTELRSEHEHLLKQHRRLKEEVAALYEASMTDALTSLKNRRAFESALREQVTKASRLGEPFTLVMIDIDHFKKVNDTYGHPGGDRVLKGVGRLLDQVAKEIEGAAFRVGGEELALILPAEISMPAAKVAEELRRRVAGASWMHKGNTITCTISIGGACIRKGEDGDQLVERADEALYRAKTSGRNRVTMAP